MSKLIHIKKIEFVRIEELQSLLLLSKTTCLFKKEVDFQPMDVYELVGVTIEDSYEDNQKIYTSTVTFQTSCKGLPDGRRWAFRLTSIDGKRYLLGCKERPYPIIKVKNNFPGKPTDTTLDTVTISWKSPLPMLLIVE